MTDLSYLSKNPELAARQLSYLDFNAWCLTAQITVKGGYVPTPEEASYMAAEYERTERRLKERSL